MANGIYGEREILWNRNLISWNGVCAFMAKGIYGKRVDTYNYNSKKIFRSLIKPFIDVKPSKR